MVGDTPCISEMSPLPLQLRPNDFEDGPHQNYNTLVIRHCWLELLKPKRLWKWPFVHYFELLRLFASCVALYISTIIHWCVFLCTFVCFLVFLEISLYIGIYLSISLYICIFHSISLYICIYLSISLYICMFLKAGVCRSLWQLELDTSPPPTSSLPVSRYTQYTLQKILPDVFCLYLCISHPYFKVVCLAMHNACSTGVCTYTECVCSMMIQWRCIEDPYLNLTDVSSDLWLREGAGFNVNRAHF